MKNIMVYFYDMRDAANGALAVTENQSYPDDLRKAALERYLEVIGEAAKRIPRDLQPQWPDIQWKEIVDLRNAISHEYEVFSLAKLVVMTRNNIPPLIAAIDVILAAEKD